MKKRIIKEDPYKSTEDYKFAKKQLKMLLNKKDKTIYCILRHVSQSGMTRRISFYTTKKGQILHLDYLISCILPYYPQIKDQAGLRVSGCGMDMGFAVVYDLGRALYKKNGKDAGYTLNQKWL